MQHYMNRKVNIEGWWTQMHKQTLTKRCILEIIQTHKLATLFLVLIILSGVFLSLLPPQLLRIFIDQVLPQSQKEALWLWAIAYFALLACLSFLDMIKGSMLAIFGQRLSKEIRISMMEKMTHLPAQTLSGSDGALLASYFLNDAQTISKVFSSGIITILIDSLKIIGILVSILWFSLPLAVLIFCLLPLLFFFTRFIQKRMLEAQMKNRQCSASLTQRIAQAVQNFKIIRCFHKEAYIESRFQDQLQESYEVIDHINFYDALYSPITQIVQALVIGTIVLLAGGYLPFSFLSLGMAAASMELIANLFSPLESIGSELQSLQEAMSGIHRVNEFATWEEEEEGCDCVLADPEHFHGLHVEHVVFAYQEGKTILQDANFAAHIGKKTTLIGGSGAGKSTIFQLLLGMLLPQSGCIFLNGEAVHRLDRKQLRSYFGYVDQHFVKVGKTIKDQITMMEDIDQTQIESIMKECGLHETILRCANQYDTIMEEHLFSQGQLQLLSFARALVFDPDVLLLDEMSADLDSESEQKIRAILQKEKQKRIILSITHRMEMVEADDEVWELNQGYTKRIS